MQQTSGRNVAVVGAGIVGVVSASYLLREGHDVTLIDERDPGEMASFGNTGGISPASVVPIAMPGMLKDVPKWLMDPAGPLFIDWAYLPRCLPWLVKFLRAGSSHRIEAISLALTALNMPTFEAYEPLLKEAGLEHLFRRTGQLFVYRSGDEFEKDRPGIDLKRATGVGIEILDARDIRDLEPNLSPDFVKAHYIPTHGHCKDPGGLVKGLAEHFVRSGGRFVKGRVQRIESRDDGASLLTAGGDRLAADVAVLAAGIWSKPLVEQLGYRVPLETQRGYHVTLPDPRTGPTRMVLSVTDKAAITPMEMGLRIAGTVELAGLDAPPNYARARKLLEIGGSIFPGLNAEGYTQWMGHRPCTPDSLPVLGRGGRHSNIVFAFGHGHQGLLGASKTGHVVAEIVGDRTPSIDLTPFSIERFS